MKRVFLWALLGMVMMSFAGCKDDGPQNEKSIYLTVNSNEWKFDKDLQQFYAHFNIPEISSNAYNYGNYSVYRVYNVETPNEYQVALPETTYLIEVYTDEESGEKYEYYYQQHVNYRVGFGYVEIQVTNSDYMYAPENPERMDFHLQLLW